MPRFVLAGLLLLLVAAPAAAQRSYPTGTPEQAVRSMAEAARAADWDGFASLMHPAALEEMRDLFSSLFVIPDAEELVQALFGVGTADDAANLTDRQLFAALMRSVEAQQENADAMRTAEVTVLGTVAEGADTVHVVQRVNLSVGPVPMTVVSVSSVRRDGDQWLGLLTAEVSGLAAMLRQLVEEAR